MDTKNCTKCNTVKKLDEFYKNKRGRKGRDSMCIPCRRVVNSMLRMASKPEVCEICYGLKNIKKVRFQNREYKDVCNQCIGLMNGRAYVENLERLAKQNKESL